MNKTVISANIPAADLSQGQIGSLATLSGTPGNDSLTGDGGSDDTLSGGDGNDTLNGGGGNDVVYGGNGNDTFQSFTDVPTSTTRLFGGEGDDLFRVTRASSVQDRSTVIIDGGAGNDRVEFDVRAGNLTAIQLTGGQGQDTYVLSLYGYGGDTNGVEGGNVVLDFAGGAGGDRLDITALMEFSGFTGTVAEFLAAGYVWAQSVGEATTICYEPMGGGHPGSSDQGGTGRTLVTLFNIPPSSITADNFVVSGQRVGGAGADRLTGTAGDEILIGGAGSDTMSGGAGNDVYQVDAAGDVVIELAAGGFDRVETTLAAYTLGANVEHLRYTGAAVFTGTGNALDNAIDGGNTGARLDGGAGDDTLSGGNGNDSLQGGAGNDAITAGAGKDTVDGGAGADQLRGLGEFASYTIQRPSAADTVLTDGSGNVLTVRNVENFAFADGNRTLAQVQDNHASAGNDNLHGGAGNDVLNGGLGIDTLAGGAGDDIYVIASAASTVLELEGQGADLVQVALVAAGTYTLAENVENATVTAAAGVAVNLTGNVLDNSLTGNAAANVLLGGAGDDTLDGAAGADKLSGGSGDDLYLVDVAGDVVTELANEGADTVHTVLASYTLGANLEYLDYAGKAAFTGIGNALDNNISGGDAGNKLDGGAGNDQLTGGLGADSLQGGLGNDAFVGAAGKDTIDGGAGSDELRGLGSLDGYTVSRPNATDVQLTDQAGNVLTVRNVESFNFDGVVRTLDEVQYNIASIGNDKLVGTSLADTLNGGLGADTLTGGDGDDAYIVDNTSDTIVEDAGQGVDTVTVALATAGATYTLAANVEHATLTSAAAVNLVGNGENNALTGNGAANTLSGGAGNDILDGGAGADKLNGGAGDDIYYVAEAGDVVTEAAGEGADSVLTTLASYVLTAHVETLTYSGAAAFTGTGNAQDNAINGGDKGNKLDGGAGNDTLTGGAGNDSLSGGLGDDVLRAGLGKDSIDGGAGGLDVAVLHDSPGGYTVTRPTAADTVLTDSAGNSVTLRNVEFVQIGGSTVSIENMQFNIGSPGGDYLTGQTGDDRLDGGAGADTLEGYTGDDTYVISDKASVIIENAGEGLDVVEVKLTTAGTYVLAHNVEDALVTAAASVAVNLTGNELDNYLSGNAAANTLVGGIGDDTLDGGAGSDVLKGGVGDDFYGVTDSGDSVVELAGEGMDTVVTTLASYTLGANLEILQYAGASLFTGTGNALANLIIAGQGGSRLNGGAGDDVLAGGNGNDSLAGGSGDDVLIAGAGKDSVDGGAGIDLLAVLDDFSSYTVTRPNATDTVLTHYTGAVTTLRNVEYLQFADGLISLEEAQFNSASPGADVLYGSEYDDILDGGLGNDTLVGGGGDDYYMLSAPGDFIYETAGNGTDVALLDFVAAGTYTMDLNVEEAVMRTLSTVAINVIGNAQDNVIFGNAGANKLSGGAGGDTLGGGAGNDTLIGGAGDDRYLVGETGDVVTEALGEGYDVIFCKAAAYTMGANIEDLVFEGSGAFSGTGSAGDNRLFAGSSSGARLDGAAGDDVLVGGAGNDSLSGGLGHDLIGASGGKDTVDGGAGFDELYGLGAFGSYTVARPNATDTVLTDAQGVVTIVRGVEYFFFDGVAMTLAQVQNNTASIGNDVINGGAGDDVIDGGLGADTLVGGAGDDVYLVDNAGDLVTEGSDQGHDQVKLALASGTYVIGDNVEDATITSNGALHITGNAVANRITGNGVGNKLVGGAGDDTLDGGAGNDTLVGGEGDDVYLADATGDVATELADQGHDKLRVTAAAYTLGANIEDMAYAGSGAFTGTGNALDNVITGGNGGGKLDGGAGNDTLTGGAGNDNLLGGAGNDEIEASAGADTIDGGLGEDGVWLAGAFADYTIARPNATDMVLTDRAGNVTTLRNVEHLYFALNHYWLEALTSNVATPGNDALQGGVRNDTLDGLAGNDTMSGGLGDDVYLVGAAGDVIVESAGQGIDQANVAFTAAGTYVLADNLENATVTAAAGVAVHLTGNGLDNVLTGNAAANTLLGGAGNDTLNGGAGGDSLAGGDGDDVYVVDAAGDKVVEGPDGGSDRVDTTLTSYTLAANVENLRYTGAAAFTGTGNALANTIVSGAGNDVLSGGAGNDVLMGGAGSDKLTGGSGADLFVVSSLVGSDTVTDFVSGTDHLSLNLAALDIGNGDLALDGAMVRAAPGGFAADAELVLFSQRMASATTANAAAVIGSASAAYAVGDSALFAVSTSTATILYRFTSSGADAVVSAAELTQLVVLTGTPATVLADYVM